MRDFYLKALNLRKDAKLFPFCKVCLLKSFFNNYECTEITATKLAKLFDYFCDDNNWKVIKPAPSLIAKLGTNLGGKY